MQPTSRPDTSHGRHGHALAALIATVGLLAGLLVAGCGGEDGETTAAGADTGAESTDATAEPDVADADAGDVEVIEGWIGALSDGDTEAAAGYFAIPSTAENLTVLTKIGSKSAAVAFNESLPCGGELVAAETTGDFTTATFELTDRPGGDCGAGTGGEASTSFVIEDGKITDWRRVAGPGEDVPDSAGQSGQIS
jgi:hypothetical protein